MSDHFSAEEARAWASAQSPPFRIKFRSKLARRLTRGGYPTITIRGTVYTDEVPIRVESLIHEFKHVLQGMVEFRWWWLFVLAYYWALIFQDGSYAANRYEEAARKYAKQRLAEVLGWLADHRNPLTQARP